MILTSLGLAREEMVASRLASRAACGATPYRIAPLVVVRADRDGGGSQTAVRIAFALKDAAIVTRCRCSRALVNLPSVIACCQRAGKVAFVLSRAAGSLGQVDDKIGPGRRQRDGRPRRLACSICRRSFHLRLRSALVQMQAGSVRPVLRFNSLAMIYLSDMGVGRQSAGAENCDVAALGFVGIDRAVALQILRSGGGH